MTTRARCAPQRCRSRCCHAGGHPRTPGEEIRVLLRRVRRGLALATMFVALVSLPAAHAVADVGSPDPGPGTDTTSTTVDTTATTTPASDPTTTTTATDPTSTTSTTAPAAPDDGATTSTSTTTT